MSKALPESLYALSHNSRTSSPSTSKQSSLRSSPATSAASVLHTLDPILTSYSNIYSQFSQGYTSETETVNPRSLKRPRRERDKEGKRGNGRERDKGKEKEKEGNTSSFASNSETNNGSEGFESSDEDEGGVETADELDGLRSSRRGVGTSSFEAKEAAMDGWKFEDLAAPLNMHLGKFLRPMSSAPVEITGPLPIQDIPEIQEHLVHPSTPTPQRRQERGSVHELLVERKAVEKKPGFQSTLEGMVHDWQHSLSSHSFTGSGEKDASHGGSCKKDRGMRINRSKSPLKPITNSVKRGSQSLDVSNLSRRSSSYAVQVANDSSTSTSDDPTHKSFRLYMRLHLLPSTILLIIPLSILIFHFFNVPSPPLPPSYLIVGTILLSLISILRLSPDSYLMVPFTDERGYRPAKTADDGIAFSFAMPILLAAGCYWDTYNGRSPPYKGLSTFVPIWTAQGLASTSSTLTSHQPTNELTDSLLESRASLLGLLLVDSLTLALQIFLASFFLCPTHITRSNTRRWLGANTLSIAISTLLGLALWVAGDWATRTLKVSPVEAAISSFVYQNSHYMVSRLTRRGFTVGELSIVCGTGNSLLMEWGRLSLARWYFKRGYPNVPPLFRNPTPLISFQHVLIPGSFVIGFILAPMLIMSRHLGQQRSYRLKGTPTERSRMRKLFAAGVYLGMLGIIFFVLGLWAGWILGPGISIVRPWAWTLRWVFWGKDGSEKGGEGARAGGGSWKRILLMYYWAGVGLLAFGGWQTRYSKMRRMRRAGVGVNSAAAAKGKDKEGGGEERRGGVSLNLKRKLFHALAVVLFVPGIAIDPAFTSLAFSVAFSVFVFTEYARYFALYPIGGALHVFFAEFVDSKDAGPVILSHFFLLTGCGGALWLEGDGIKLYTGVLVLGIGDALASIVGRKIGYIRWPGTSKTIEGTIAFILSVHFAALTFRFFSLVPYFNAYKYLLAVVLSGLLEATSNQNDNVVIPIYMWATLSLLGI